MSSGAKRIERRLAAIFAADVAGYSRLISADEVGTLRTLAAHRETMDRLIAEHGGRIANTAGDSVLAEFPSVVDAVQCAVSVQKDLTDANAGVPEDRALRFRIGVHVGDVVVRDGDLLGDGVNIAARLQEIATPGGVFISGRAHEEVEGKLDVWFDDQGEQQLKNIGRLVRVFSVSTRHEPAERHQPQVQEIRYCRTSDGIRLAWAKSGSGPPLVKAANWLNHLQHDWDSPVWRGLLEGLGDYSTLYRYDTRGNGLSDRETGELNLETFVGDLEAVVAAAGLDRFPLLGISQGAAVSIAYAIRHPEKVSHLILLSGFALGAIKRSAKEREARLAMAALMRVGWEADDPTFREMFVSRLFPDAAKEQTRVYAQQQRETISGEAAARFFVATGEFDIRDLLAEVRVPTLVLHTSGDLANPLQVGRELASGISGAQFVVLPSRNHVPATGEPATSLMLEHMRRFLGR
jgi:class 3 adenylate cyclase/pimeloyl-ACP methyl ester carboxylesterase